MQKVFDLILYRPFECVIKIDIDDIVIFKNRELTTLVKRL